MRRWETNRFLLPRSLRAGFVSAMMLFAASAASAWQVSLSLDSNPIEVIRERVAAAEEGIDLVVYKFDEASVRRALEAALRRGVVVRILADAKEAARDKSHVPELDQLGAEVRLWQEGKLHAKFLVIDGREAIQGSANLTKSAAKKNVELLMRSEVPNEIKQMEQLFERLWAKGRAPDG